ncbi:probable purine permease 10 [Cucurbita pepo subsp. pepo]|uniref:probable purine permease 10 n=1 Tax=Cucurbita pepo subsp. pepo TaxID=3664 RepID=UPI000C9DA073|nr:probable purine permease 10 [Cucurbita pepo subsp. pepo]
MGNNGELQLPFEEDEKTINVNPTNDTSSMNLDQPRRSLQTKPNYQRWLRIVVYTFLLLSGQSVGTMLGRLYFDKGGKSKWLATLVSLIGFPILLPLYMIKSPKISSSNITLQSNPPTTTKLIFVYVSLGLLVAINCFLYSVGLMYLHVSTFSLICASQLAFNALFSYFINSLVFTPFIVNSLVLLTISSSLLIFQSDPVSDTSSDGPEHPTSRAKFITGFVCTVAASAGYGLVLSLTQLAFKKVIKKETFKAVLDMIIYQSIVSSSAILIGFFASGEWKTLKMEMDGFHLGKVSYKMTLFWTAISWQVFSVGSVGLIFDVSSLFSNAIGALGLPIVPVFAVIFFHDNMDGIKIVAMILAVWGFVSYGYQNYLDDLKSSSKVENRDSNEVSRSSSLP